MKFCQSAAIIEFEFVRANVPRLLNHDSLATGSRRFIRRDRNVSIVPSSRLLSDFFSISISKVA